MVEDLLAGKTALITGAGRNIGAGIAGRFAEHGAAVVVNDVDADRAEAVVADLETPHDQDHRPLACDAIDPAAVADAAAMVEADYGGLDVLVNNLGYAVNKGVFDTSLEEWHRVVDLTLTSAFLWTKHCGPLLIEAAGGAVVNLGSRLGSVGSSEKVAYCAAKGGVINLTRQLAVDLAAHGVRVNAISPGNVGSPVGTDELRTDLDTASIPLGRVGEPADVADAALFLASDLSSYVTGANLPVDGGKGA